MKNKDISQNSRTNSNDKISQNEKTETDLNKNLEIGYKQAMDGEGITTEELLKRLKEKNKSLSKT